MKPKSILMYTFFMIYRITTHLLENVMDFMNYILNISTFLNIIKTLFDSNETVLIMKLLLYYI